MAHCPDAVDIVCSVLRLEGSCTMKLLGKARKICLLNLTLYIDMVPYGGDPGRWRGNHYYHSYIASRSGFPDMPGLHNFCILAPPPPPKKALGAIPLTPPILPVPATSQNNHKIVQSRIQIPESRFHNPNSTAKLIVRTSLF